MQDENMMDDETSVKAKRNPKEGKVRQPKVKGASPKAGVVKENKKNKAGAEPTDDEIQIARLLVRAMWTIEWTEANPDKSPSDRSATWKQERAAVNDAQLKKMRKVLANLKGIGVTMTAREKAAKSDAPDESSDDE